MNPMETMPGKDPDILLVSEEESTSSKTQPFARFLTAPREAVSAKFGLPPLPKNPSHQLGIVALGTYLRNNGFTPLLMDRILTVPGNWSDFEKVLSRGIPAVGISTSLLITKETVKKITDAVRSASPKALVILGGQGALINPDIMVLGDITVKGAGEKPLLEIMKALKSKTPLKKIPNIYVNRGGNCTYTFDAPPLPLDELPSPDWSLFKERPFSGCAVRASEGCVHRCAFCAWDLPGKQEFRSAALVVEEMRLNKELHGFTSQWIIDSNFTSSSARVSAICDLLLERGVKAEWACFGRTDDFVKNPDMAEKMRAAGCVSVLCGVESGDDSILKAMRKGTDVKTNLEGIRLLKKAGLRPYASFLIGCPGETEVTIRNTLDFIRGSEIETSALIAFRVPTNTHARVWVERKTFGVEGSWKNWKHGTMTSKEVYIHVQNAIERICLEMPGKTLGGPIPDLLGFGLTVNEVSAYLGAVRDYNFAEKKNEAALLASAENRIADALKKIHSIWNSRLSSPGVPAA